MQVARLELDDMDFTELPNPIQMTGREHRALAQVGTQVVDEYASFNVAGSRQPAVQPVSTHYWEHRFDLMTTVRLYNTLTRQKEP
ncbi:MAG TPA: hypothetical protein VF956_01925, partial [Candidatus Dormibacteraeota bacterium]